MADDDARAQLASILARESGAVAASAARMVETRRLAGLEESLAAAFARILALPAKRDPQCVAKRAIAHALVELDIGHPAQHVYASGARHVQLEPVFGGKVDTAAALRATCALGLLITAPPTLWASLADLLCDPEPEARSGAIHAIARSGNPHVGVPLLRVRAGIRDPDGRVTADCLGALLALDADGSIDFVAVRLRDEDPAVAEGAALALGESRHPRALDRLRDFLSQPLDDDLLRAGYLSVMLLRSDAGRELLLEEVRTATAHRACLALEALGHDATHLRDDVVRAAASRGEPDVRAALHARFG